MFATPDKNPFYGGTYFPPKRMYNRASWLEVLQAVHTSWLEKKEEVISQAKQMTDYIENLTINAKNDKVILDLQVTEKIASNLIHLVDKENGGFSSAPKFPATMAILYLLDYAHFQKSEDALSAALLSLDKMIAGGIYDQIGSGFSRYATDNYWLVPHFEKMLYDNALLIQTLATAFLITNDLKYKTVIEDTIAFCNRELICENNLWYAAIDADSEEEEGKYYVWSYQEIKEIIPDIHPAIIAYWGILENGNWEGTNILHQAKSEKEIIEQYGLQEEVWQALLQNAKQKLFAARNQRVRPQTDIKVILSWNALMINALIQAGKALQNTDYINSAVLAMDTMLKVFNQKDKKALLRVHTKGKTHIEATLEDYAYFIQALLTIYSETANEPYLTEAKYWLEYVNHNFSDRESVYYYFSSKTQTNVPVRKIDKYDGATPSANAIMAYNLWTIGNITYNFNHIERAEVMLHQMSGSVLRYSSSFAQWAIFTQYYTQGWKQLMIITHKKEKPKFSNSYLPQVYSLIINERQKLPEHLKDMVKNEEELYILCEKGTCNFPVKSPEQIFSE